MKRFTPKQLTELVTELNQSLIDNKIKKQFECGGRNGYQAVDEYSIDDTNQRIGSGVDRNVTCGSSREVAAECKIRFYQLLAK